MDDVQDNGLDWEQTFDRRSLLGKAAVAGGVLAAGGLLTSRASAGSSATAGKVTAFFGQFGAIAEQEGIRKYVFKGFDGDVDAAFAPITAPTQFVDRVRAEAKAGKARSTSSSVSTGTSSRSRTRAHPGRRRRRPQIKTLPPALVKHGKLGTKTQYYVPHSQATYVMVANKDVMKYLPRGADINAITYGQLFQWAKAIRRGTGQNRFGLPASETGLMHRFLQGFLVPSFTGRFVTAYRSKEAVAAWEYLRQLWQYTHPQSLSYAFMQDPLLSQEVLLGWDHVARLKTALDQRPDDLVAFPVPRGPKARSYMPVLVGMGIPKNAPEPRRREGVDPPPREARPTGGASLADGLLPGRRRSALQADLARATRRGRSRRKAAAGEGRRPGAAPDRHRRGGGNFSKYYRDTFTRIVRNGEDIQKVLNEQGELLDQIFAKTNAPCWAPDPPSGKARCRVA